MPSSLTFSPFEPRRQIGTACEVGPTHALVNLPTAAAPSRENHFGDRFGAGEVGEFVCFECGLHAVLGRITTVKLPERDREDVEARLGRNVDVHPVGRVQLLTSIELETGKVTGGISEYPRLGCLVYSAPPALISHIAERFGVNDDAIPLIALDIGTISGANDLPISVTPERIFGRHCAVLGTTGGGKSYTLARLIEQCAGFNSRIILLDATGEFRTLGNKAEHVYIGDPVSPEPNAAKVDCPYQQMTELDLFALISPSRGIQAPKLRSAFQSLRLANLLGPNHESKVTRDGRVVKRGKEWRPIYDAIQTHALEVNAPNCVFDIWKLTGQIEQECVLPIRGSEPKYREVLADNDLGWCSGMISRISAMLQSSALQPLFRRLPDPGALGPPFPSVFDRITAFLSNSGKRILRISLEHIQSDYSAREVIANCLGRDLLTRARSGSFVNACPLVVILDEAHQFLNRAIGNEDFSHRLDAFEIIAKEGRKYWLTICMATQRPRDIPDGVLSQMGTLIVHRLINDSDREVVERAAGEIDRSAASFLPTLGPGEAVIIGVDFPIPLTIQINKPSELHRPRSAGPDFQNAWSDTTQGGVADVDASQAEIGAVQDSRLPG